MTNVAGRTNPRAFFEEMLSQSEAELCKLSIELSKLMAGQQLELTKKAAEFAHRVCEGTCWDRDWASAMGATPASVRSLLHRFIAS